MEITRTFTSGFRDIMRAKLRRFVRRSAYLYAVGVALFTVGIHGTDAALTLAEKVIRGVAYFAVVCAGAGLTYMVSAVVQSRRSVPRTITFAEDGLSVVCAGQLARHGWEWILAAEESSTELALLVSKAPRLELFLAKAKLDADDYRVLRGWLVARGKLRPMNGMT